MKTLRKMVRTTSILTLMGSMLSCGAAGDDASDTADDSGVATDSADPTAPDWEDARPIIEAHCSRCHSANRLSTYRRLETHRDVTSLRTNILDKLRVPPPRGQRMPLTSNHTDDSGCVPDHPQINDKRLSTEDIDTLIAFLGREDHLDYEDTTPPLVAPEVPLLADAVAYTSSQFDVLNDGFLEHPDGANDDYMHDYGYDEREYDQMEDDWFCIQFDPGRTDPGYLTGIQALTESGQIYLSSQLVIDTTGASDTARAAAEESGSDWYRCDGGLDFADAIPLWRTVPGGEAIELPQGTGLRFEPGWTFVLRADFHTHFDAVEFDRLEQNGVIDYDAGTMTWFNRATVRAQWAAPTDVSRELSWLVVEPSTQAERDGFAVPPGETTLSYQATIPAQPDTDYAVFSAEVGAGKLGHNLNLRETTGGTCIANNSDFAPKWIEQAIYGEGDAPVLDDESVLELTCAYRSNEAETLTWGAEGEATVWARKERCSSVLFYYELP